MDGRSGDRVCLWILESARLPWAAAVSVAAAGAIQQLGDLWR
jgi:hypothetical protein